MDFHQYRTIYDEARQDPYAKALTNQEIYNRAVANLRKDDPQRDRSRFTFLAEAKWLDALRVYYKLFPAFTGALLKIKLNVNSEELSLPVETVCIRLSDVETKTPIRAMLLTIRPAPETGEGNRYFHIAAECPLGYFCADAILQPGQPVPQTDHNDVSVDDQDTDQGRVIRDALHIAVAVALLSRDPDIISPDVLNRDKPKLPGATAEDIARMFDRAKRNKKFGWTIGEAYEAMPHYRRPHLALRHTGPGRTIPRIVMVKGTIVHRTKMAEVPTGHMLPDGTEVEV